MGETDGSGLARGLFTNFSSTDGRNNRRIPRGHIRLAMAKKSSGAVDMRETSTTRPTLYMNGEAWSDKTGYRMATRHMALGSEKQKERESWLV